MCQHRPGKLWGDKYGELPDTWGMWADPLYARLAVASGVAVLVTAVLFLVMTTLILDPERLPPEYLNKTPFKVQLQTPAIEDSEIRRQVYQRETVPPNRIALPRRPFSGSLPLARSSLIMRKTRCCAAVERNFGIIGEHARNIAFRNILPRVHGNRRPTRLGHRGEQATGIATRSRRTAGKRLTPRKSESPRIVPHEIPRLSIFQ